MQQLKKLPPKHILKILTVLLLILGLALAAAGCGEPEDEGQATPPQEEDPAVGPGEGGSGEEPVDYEALGVNEAGEIMVLMYHEIGEPEDEWVRTPENFRKDLQELYDAGYRAVSMNDVLDGRIDIPAGTTPVVLTFDDGRAGQFRYIEKEGELVMDPDCAVAILEEFYEAHPDFGLAATFYLFYSGVPFGQPDLVQKKLDYLVERGFEIG
ncbi:MAG TPA: polysaccharide deacetylase, partial [Bacillota bacterium]|nr:polysaccharide deacetylase [Bacillota bacterium]